MPMHILAIASFPMDLEATVFYPRYFLSSGLWIVIMFFS